MYIDKLDDTVNKYKNIYHSTIKMEPVDVKSRIYIEIVIQNNEKHPKFEIVGHIRISKYIIFAKGNTKNRSEEVFVEKIEDTGLWHM